MNQIVAVGLSATIQQTISFNTLQKDAVNRSTGYRLDASGKAVNAARVLNQLAAGCVTAVCPLGEQNADHFLELAAADNLPVAWVPVPGRVRQCYTLLEPLSGQATELVVSEPVKAADFTAPSERLLFLIQKKLSLPDVNALLLAGSRPLSFPEDLCLRICQLAEDAGIPVMVDFHGKDLNLVLEESVPAVIKINELEFCGTFGLGFPPDEADLIRKLEEKSASLNTTIVVTRGAQDVFAAVNGVFFRSPVKPVKALNAIGCGDSFSAGFLQEWLRDRDIPAALEKGSWCASRNALNYRPGSILDAAAATEQIW